MRRAVQTDNFIDCISDRLSLHFKSVLGFKSNCILICVASTYSSHAVLTQYAFVTLIPIWKTFPSVLCIVSVHLRVLVQAMLFLISFKILTSSKAVSYPKQSIKVSVLIREDALKRSSRCYNHNFPSVKLHGPR
jgi:hypothetical protein